MRALSSTAAPSWSINADCDITRSPSRSPSGCEISVSRNRRIAHQSRSTRADAAFCWIMAVVVHLSTRAMLSEKKSSGAIANIDRIQNYAVACPNPHTLPCRRPLGPAATLWSLASVTSPPPPIRALAPLDEFRAYFEQYGPVKESMIMKDGPSFAVPSLGRHT